MLYVLADYFRELLARLHMEWLVRLLTQYIDFRAVLSIVLSFAFVVVLGPRVIRRLIALKIGDNPEFYNQTLNELTAGKRNTPTMGGILICGAVLFCTLLLADIGNFYVQMALLCMIWLAVLGGFDDWLKLTSARRKPGSREGLYTWEKLLFQLGLAVILGLFIHSHGAHKLEADPHHLNQMSHALNLPFIKTWSWDPSLGTYVPSEMLVKFLTLGAGAFVVLTVLVITGSSNAVNLTDGMDGLASGIMAIVAFAFMILALIAGEEMRSKFLLVPYIPESDELAIVAGAMVGSCLGFLWFNCHPAQVFMGDTGSLTLGGLIGYIAVVVRQEFLLLIIGGVFVAEALSVMVQVGFFKATKKQPGGGRRLLKCAPVHHHFHLSGWTENQVVVRFWIITVVLAALALATIKVR
ncbi:MAG: phospho-N-acetylmuramoyl-pentapeptide-transferase [Phycisphaeraceae bacterium]